MSANNEPEKQILMQLLQEVQPDIQFSSLLLLDKQQSHQRCMLCGTQALLGLKLNFYSSCNHQVWARVKGTIHQQGYQGILHGGFLSALLDSGMCQALFKQNIEAVTADMNIRYLHEVPINSDILITGKIISSHPPLYKVEGELYVDGKLMVKSSGRFMKKGFGKNKNV